MKTPYERIYNLPAIPKAKTTPSMRIYHGPKNFPIGIGILAIIEEGIRRGYSPSLVVIGDDFHVELEVVLELKKDIFAAYVDLSDPEEDLKSIHKTLDDIDHKIKHKWRPTWEQAQGLK